MDMEKGRMVRLVLFGIQAIAIAEWIFLLVRGRFIDRAFYCAVFPALYIGIWMFARHVKVTYRYAVAYVAAVVFAVYAFNISAAQNLSMERSETANLYF